MTAGEPRYYRIISSDGTHVATVKPELVAETVAFYNDRRQTDIDGNPLGESYRAEPFEGFVQGQA